MCLVRRKVSIRVVMQINADSEMSNICAEVWTDWDRAEEALWWRSRQSIILWQAESVCECGYEVTRNRMSARDSC